MDMESYNLVKIIKSGGRSQEVSLLTNKNGHKVIKKKYNPKIKSHVMAFNKEIKILSTLKPYQYVPKLLHIDYDNCIFYETYCGTLIPKNNPHNKTKMIARTKDLYHKYGYCYIKNEEKKWLVHWNNYCILDGNIYMIDFGSERWKRNK